MPEAPKRPQGGGRRRCDDRAVLAAIVSATSDCTWRQLPPLFGASWQTLHRLVGSASVGEAAPGANSQPSFLLCSSMGNAAKGASPLTELSP
ncbi:transposase [Streptomyces decoyicus]|uniref:transposase n=1 Tax=Streptomyces decoyicus TaxID=249567 RepID=UPI001365790D|nr:transposase [Streptomyces decoyicus]